MTKKALIAVVLIAVGFAAGVFVGYQLLAKPRLWMAAVGESFMANQYAMVKYREAEYPDAVEAIEAYIDYLDRTEPSEGPGWRPGESPWLDERGRNLDLTLAWIRLALLHEGNLNEDAATEAWAKVDSLAAKGKWKDRRHEHLRAVVQKFDGKQPGNHISGEEPDPIAEADSHGESSLTVMRPPGVKGKSVP